MTLTEADLRELGIKDNRDRRRLLDALEKIRKIAKDSFLQTT